MYHKIVIIASNLNQDLGDIIKRITDQDGFQICAGSAECCESPVPWDAEIDVRPIVGRGLCLVLEGACAPGGGNNGECIVRIPVLSAHHYDVTIEAFDGAEIPAELIAVADPTQEEKR